MLVLVVGAWFGLGAGVTSHGSSRGRRRRGFLWPADLDLGLFFSSFAHAGGGRSADVGNSGVSGPAEGTRFFETGWRDAGRRESREGGPMSYMAVGVTDPRTPTAHAGLSSTRGWGKKS